MRWATLLLGLLAPWCAAWAAPGEPCTTAMPPGITGIAGFFSSADHWQHAIVSSDGTLHEIYFDPDPRRGIFSVPLGRFPDTLAIAAFQAPADGQRRSVIVVRKSGEIQQVRFKPGELSSAVIAQVSSPVDVGGLYSDDSGNHHAIVATAAGNVFDISWQPGRLPRRDLLRTIPGAAQVAGFFTRDDGYNIVLVGTRSGDVHEIFYKDPARVGDSVVAHVAGDILDLAGFYTDDDQFRHVVVGTRGGEIRELYYHPKKGKGDRLLRTVPGLRRLGAYATTPADSWRHVIAGLDNGEVWELFYDGVHQGFGHLRRFLTAEPAGHDPSVDIPMGASLGTRASSSGVVLALAGTSDLLYAVSANAGVWASERGGSWSQLRDPPLAYSIAVDPRSPRHLLVGERNGDARAMPLNRAGVWESFNGGITWSYVFNPRALFHCNTQAVPSLAFDRESNLYAATDCGVMIKPDGISIFDQLPATRGKDITRVATQNVGGWSWVWARTVNELLFSRDAGLTWASEPLPSRVGAEVVTGTSRGDSHSLAVYGTRAVIIVTGPRGSAVLTFEAITRTWSLKDLKDGDGTGLGGRRFVKAYATGDRATPAVLLAGTGQGVFLGWADAAGAVNWQRIAEAPWGGPYDFLSPSDIHVDIWDAHLTLDGRAAVWLSTDGGVHRTDLADILRTSPGRSPAWTTLVQGLHTHHVHALSVLTEAPERRSKLIYAGPDNDEWLRNSSPVTLPPAAWRNWGLLGDSSWTHADNGSSRLAMVLRNPLLAHLTSFGDTAPTAAAKYAQTPRAFRVLPTILFNNEEYFRVIQTRRGEAADPLLDVVMLARDPTGGIVLFRNRAFAANPNEADSGLRTPDWTVADDHLPDGALRVWASGGHEAPVFYLYAESTGGPALYRRDGPGAAWRKLNVGVPLFPSPYGAIRGPAFVNPYDASHLFVATPGGIRVSHDGGTTFLDDEVLTTLVTGSGKYPLTDSFRGADESKVPQFVKGLPMANVAQIAFLRDDPGRMVVAAPYTGVFYRDEACKVWQDLSPALPRPATAVATVGIDQDGVYAGLEGRSLWQIHDYEFARQAAFFSQSGLAPRELARLSSADGAPVRFADVSVIWTLEDGYLELEGVVKTDANGIVPVPTMGPPPTPGRNVFHLAYLGSGSVAPARTSLFHTF